MMAGVTVSEDSKKLVALLSVVHWVAGSIALILLAFILMILPTSLPLAFPAILVAIYGSFVTAHMLIGNYVKLGRFRIFATVISCLEIPLFPIGTALAVFSLWVMWSSARDAFGDPLPAEPVVPPREEERDNTHTTDEGEETPYNQVLRLMRAGVSFDDIAAQLSERGLSRADIDTVMTAVPREKKRIAAPAPIQKAKPSRPPVKVREQQLRDDEETPLDSPPVKRKPIK